MIMIVTKNRIEGNNFSPVASVGRFIGVIPMSMKFVDSCDDATTEWMR